MSRSDVDRTHRERVEADRPLTRDDFDGLATALIVFLQQITGFVETSDRQIVSEVDARFARVEVALANSAELRVQLNLMQRALQYLLRASGFERVELRYSAPVPDHIKMQTVDLPAATLSSPEPQAVGLARVAHAINANAAVLNNLMFTHLDYAAVAFRS
jgi:hypothetical protein